MQDRTQDGLLDKIESDGSIGRTLIFGYGSLINNESRCGSNITAMTDAALVNIKSTFGFSRAFCVRSTTGFTCLGLLPDSNGAGICGVVYPVDVSSLEVFDQREKDYDRVLIPHEVLEIVKQGEGFNLTLQPKDCIYTYIPKPECINAASEDYPIIQTYVDTVLQGCKHWGGLQLMSTFVNTTQMWSKHYLNDCPLSRRPWLHRQDYLDIDEILSSYEEHTLFKHRRHAEEYAHSSNRSSGVEENSSGIGSDSPERISSSSQQRVAVSLTGMWGCPSRNALFVGRESALKSLYSIMKVDGFAEVTGLGGIGKSSLVAEYCHRHFSYAGWNISSISGAGTVGTAGTIAPGSYGLVVYLRAESRASIAADIRKFAFDLRVLNSGTATSGDGGVGLELDDDTIIEEFKRHLAVQQGRCLLVFDNLECPGDAGGNSRIAVAPYLPRGILGYENSFSGADHGGMSGRGPHVLVTRRIAASGSSSGSSAIAVDGDSASLALDSLRPAESLQFLSMSLSCDVDSAMEKSEEDKEMAELQVLAERLGHLPLALSQAVAFIKRVDISASEYLQRLNLCEREGMSSESRGDTAANGDVLSSVYASLSMAVQRIEIESPASVSVLMLLAWLSPDNITKRLVQTLLETLHSQQGPQTLVGACPSGNGDPSALVKNSTLNVFTPSVLWIAAGLGTIGAGVAMLILSPSSNGLKKTTTNRLCDASAFVSIVLGGSYCAWKAFSHSSNEEALFLAALPEAKAERDPSLTTAPLSASMLEADRVWETLKQYSLLTVRGTRRARIAGIHRMQQSYLRRRTLAQPGAVSLCIEQSVWAMSQMWDSQRWGTGAVGSGGSEGGAADLLDHLISLAGHVASELDRMDNVARGHSGAVRSSLPVPSSAVIHLHPWGMRTPHVLRLANLLTDVASHVTLALSRFDMADFFLGVALRLQDVNAEGSIARQYLADTYHLSGSLCRLRNHFASSRERLTLALGLRRRENTNLNGVGKGGDLGVADTLHEMGILELRQGALNAAHALLTESLDIKRSVASVSSTKTQNSNHVRDMRIGQTTVSATLHQLAVVATLRKDYDEAERLLKQALVLDGTGSAMLPTSSNVANIDIVTGSAGDAHRRLVSRAAATQQLGRVCLRRGNLIQARAYLTQSLDTYSQAYGKVMHINLSAVHHQLGSTFHALQDFDEAFASYQRALDIRLAAFAPDHMDVIRTYSEMAQCELDRGRGQEAERLWEGLQARLEKALVQAQAHSDIPRSNEGIDTVAEAEIQSTRISILIRHLLKTLYARRLYYRRRSKNPDAHDTDMVSILSASIVDVKRLEGVVLHQGIVGALSGPGSSGSSEDNGQVSKAVREAVLEARRAVRNDALSVSRACGTLASIDGDAAGVYAPLLHLPDRVERIIAPALSNTDEDDMLNGGSGSFPLLGDVALSRAAKNFCADVRALVQNAYRGGNCDTVVAQKLFDACDSLRTEVQALGMTVED